MLDLPGLCCYYKVVIDSTSVLVVLYCWEPGQGCQKLFALLNLHKEMQTYSSSAGSRWAAFETSMGRKCCLQGHFWK